VIVALFPQIEDAIAAHLACAPAGAAISRGRIAIVALLAAVEFAVAAHRMFDLALGGTAIAVVGVTVVAFLK
jgi:hypothetical protein